MPADEEVPGFPRGVESIEKVLKLAKMPLRYWKSMEKFQMENIRAVSE